MGLICGAVRRQDVRLTRKKNILYIFLLNVNRKKNWYDVGFFIFFCVCVFFVYIFFSFFFIFEMTREKKIESMFILRNIRPQRLLKHEIKKTYINFHKDWSKSFKIQSFRAVKFLLSREGRGGVRGGVFLKFFVQFFRFFTDCITKVWKFSTRVLPGKLRTFSERPFRETPKIHTVARMHTESERILISQTSFCMNFNIK